MKQVWKITTQLAREDFILVKQNFLEIQVYYQASYLANRIRFLEFLRSIHPPTLATVVRMAWR